MWDLWWTKWQWDRIFLEYFGFPLSISFHRCSITRKNEKNIFIFITALHNKPQGCGASLASATGPFTHPPPKEGKNFQIIFIVTYRSKVSYVASKLIGSKICALLGY
jgi:hypothetical protein